jgi:hypothetical protein
MKMTHRLVWTDLTIIIIGVFLFGCSVSTPTPNPTPMFTPSAEQMDKSPFTGIPCAAPCWHGLEVGKSSEDEVTSVLSTLTFINQDSIQIFRRPSMPDYYAKDFGPGVEIDASCISPRTECLVLTTANDTLQKIILRLNYEIKPDEVLEYIGAPDIVGVAPIGGEVFICEVYMIWKNSRLVLASTFRTDRDLGGVEKYCDIVRDTAKIPSNLLISEVRYLSDAELNSLLLSTNKFFEFSGTIQEK